MERTEKRFKNYGDAGLLCGTDGLPHLISDPGLALRYGHTGETLVRLHMLAHDGHVHGACVRHLPEHNLYASDAGLEVFASPSAVGPVHVQWGLMHQARTTKTSALVLD